MGKQYIPKEHVDIDFHPNWIDEKDYTYRMTREELEDYLPNTIDWSKWDEIVKKTQDELESQGIKLRKYCEGNRKTRGNTNLYYVYDLNDNLLGTYKSTDAIVKTYNIPKGTVASTLYAVPHHISYKYNIKILKENLNER